MIPGTSRGIRLPELLDQGLPIVGRVAAGDPILAEENIEGQNRFTCGLLSAPSGLPTARTRGQYD